MHFFSRGLTKPAAMLGKFKEVYPPPPGSCAISDLRRISREIFDFKQLGAKIFRTKDLGAGRFLLRKYARRATYKSCVRENDRIQVTDRCDGIYIPAACFQKLKIRAGSSVEKQVLRCVRLSPLAQDDNSVIGAKGRTFGQRHEYRAVIRRARTLFAVLLNQNPTADPKPTAEDPKTKAGADRPEPRA